MPSDHPKPSAEKAPKTAGSGRRATGRRKALPRPAILEESGEGLRLQKFLANVGIESRRNCESFIRDGRVTVDGQIVTDPALSVKPEEQDVRLDGDRLRLPQHKYFLLHKPKGVLCTNKDPDGRPRAIDYVPSQGKRLFTVGRLDENTSGLLLITNDGALAEHLAHPRYEVVRRYRAQVAGVPEPETLAELRKGMYFSDGFFRFQSIRMLKRKGKSTFLELELREGKNREIRRLLARAGHKVVQLERLAFGPLKLGNLPSGKCRELSIAEVRELFEFVTASPQQRAEQAAAAAPPRRTGAGKRSASRRPFRDKLKPEKPRRGAGRHETARPASKSRPKSRPRKAPGRKKK